MQTKYQHSQLSETIHFGIFYLQEQAKHPGVECLAG